MNEAQRNVALFRYSLIREPADELLTVRQRGQLVRELAGQHVPDRPDTPCEWPGGPSTGGIRAGSGRWLRSTGTGLPHGRAG